MNNNKDIILFENVIVSDFEGWSGDTVFEFQNGQKWKQSVYQYRYMYAYRPQAKIVNRNGQFLLIVNGFELPVVKLQ